jgi:5'-3' exonuclease
MTICIIDGDVVAYKACQNRYKTKEGHILITAEPLQFTDEQNAAYLENAWIRAQEIVNDLKQLCFTDTAKMAVKGNGCFRMDIYPEYKAHRNPDVKKKQEMNFVPLLRQRMVDHGLAVAAHGMEADDYLRIWAEEARAAGEDYVICSIDKDLRCIPGTHYLMHKNERIFMSEADSMRFYYEQLLIGDATDNVKGCIGIGPVRAKKYLADCTTEEEFQIAVTEMYQVVYGKYEWEQQLDLNGRLIYILKSLDDMFSRAFWPEVVYVMTEAEIQAEQEALESEIRGRAEMDAADIQSEMQTDETKLQEPDTINGN